MQRPIAAAVFLLGSLSLNAAPPASENLVPVTVRVQMPAGEAARDAYVALVPLWRPASRPQAEEIAKKGVSYFHVSPGTYLLIAGAKGVAFTSQELVVAPKSGADKSVRLSALETVKGIVRDGDGHPVAGARVIAASVAIPAPLGKLSALAGKYLLPDRSTTTDSRGEWSLGSPAGASPMLIEAPGFGAEWRNRPKDAAAILDVSLSKGATLNVTTDRVDTDMIVTLAQEGAGAATSIPADQQPLVWAKWATSKTLDWSSLAPGVYGIYTRYPEPRYFMQAATKIATVTLSPAEHRSVRIALPPVRRPATSVASLFVEDASDKGLGEGLEAFGSGPDGLARGVESVVEDVVGGWVIYLNTEGARPPFHAMTKNRFVTPTGSLANATRDANAKPWPAAAYPRADAQVKLRFAEKDVQIPKSGMARQIDCGEESHGIAVPFEIRKDGFARFTVAAACQSLVLEVEPFEPVVTRKNLQPGEQSLGEFILRAAGLADVRVARDPGGALVAGATVRIATRDDESETKAPIVVAERVTDERGWAHFSGLPPYRELKVTAETPQGEKADGVTLRVKPRERSVVDPLGVPEPATLVVDAKIDAAVLSRFPSARVVALDIAPPDPSRESERMHESVADAPIRFGPLRPGRWLVSGLVVIGKSWEPFELGDLELKAGETRRLDARITPNVFEGIAVSEGKPVAAKIFVDVRGQTMAFSSDPAGVFSVILEEKGIYRVAAAPLRAQSNVSPIGDIAFTDPSRRIEIEMPRLASVTTRVRVGDQPAPHVMVRMSRRDDGGSVDRMTDRVRTTDLEGKTTFDDISSGLWTFTVKDAESGSGVEKSIAVEAGDDKTIDLDLDTEATIEGTIRGLGGSPLPHARVDCLFVGSTGNPDRASAVSNAEGDFHVDLIPPAPPYALCGVIGPMGSVDAARMIPGQRSEVTVPGSTGTLRISNWTDRVRPDTSWLVAPDGRAVSLSTVADALGQFGSTLTIPALAAGRWMLVRVESMPQWLTLANGLGASLPAVSEITIRSGITETIQQESEGRLTGIGRVVRPMLEAGHDNAR